MKLTHLQTWLKPVLLPFSFAYSFAMRVRRGCYAKRVLSSFTPDIPCVAIGNISWGGTGKTPLVSWFLHWAETHDLRAAVLTRGYGGTPEYTPLSVTPGTSPVHSGDEPLLLARKHTQASVIVSPKRSQGATFAQKNLAPDLFILDDGMQHLAVRRHLDIVLLRPEDLKEQWNCVIPAGSWREGLSALKAADAFLIRIPSDRVSSIEHDIANKLQLFAKPVFSFSLQTTELTPLIESSNTPSLLQKAGRLPGSHSPYILASGVGEPAQVLHSTVKFMGYAPEKHIVFPDHHAFTEQNAAHLAASGMPVLCTPKDAVKLELFAPVLATVPVFVLQPDIVFGPYWFSTQNFAAWWQQWWEQRHRHL